MDDKNCYLVLENGKIFFGRCFGSKKPVSGEIGKHEIWLNFVQPFMVTHGCTPFFQTGFGI